MGENQGQRPRAGVSFGQGVDRDMGSAVSYLAGFVVEAVSP